MSARSTKPVSDAATRHLAEVIAGPTIGALGLSAVQADALKGNPYAIAAVREAITLELGEAIRPFIPVQVPRASDDLRSERVTRHLLLGLFQEAGVRILCNDLRHASFGTEIDEPVRLDYILLPAEVDAIFAKMDSGELPWNRSKVDQQVHFGGSIMGAVGVLMSLYTYVEARKILPRPDCRWEVRCSEAYQDHYTYKVAYSQKDGLCVTYYYQEPYAITCAFPARGSASLSAGA
jgi:hypothetical protein